MKIAIIGYGKMGKMIEQAAAAAGHTITAAVDPLAQISPNGARLFRGLAEAGDLCGAEAAIEFTQPGTALANIKILAERKIPAVIGTTGWHDKLDEARQAVEQAGSSLIWSSNFSLGVYLFYRIAWYAAQLADSFPEYDIGGFEAHHNKKMDSPSGTARTLVDGVLERVKRKEKAVWETLSRRPQPDELHFLSLRMGSVPGTHSLFFDSAADTIEITHTARSREGFAAGAVRAAQWLAGSPAEAGSPDLRAGGGPRKGFFTIDDMLKDLLK
jgi:4-hydroxy-tetrahydrodipicolinate reductase